MRAGDPRSYIRDWACGARVRACRAGCPPLARLRTLRSRIVALPLAGWSGGIVEANSSPKTRSCFRGACTGRGRDVVGLGGKPAGVGQGWRRQRLAQGPASFAAAHHGHSPPPTIGLQPFITHHSVTTTQIISMMGASKCMLPRPTLPQNCHRRRPNRSTSAYQRRRHAAAAPTGAFAPIAATAAAPLHPYFRHQFCHLL